MEIKRGNTVVCDVYLKDNSYTVEEIMGEDTLTLNFLSRNVVNLQINDYIDFEGTKYKIRHNEKVTKKGDISWLGIYRSVLFKSVRPFGCRVFPSWYTGAEKELRLLHRYRP